MTDHTHDPYLRSWVESANDPDGDFPIQNLPLAIFRRAGSEQSFRPGIAIGTFVLDVAHPAVTTQLSDVAPVLESLTRTAELNPLMGQGRPALRALRHAVSRALRHDNPERQALAAALVPQAETEYALPVRVGDFSDFYCSIHHAQNVGKLFRPDNPLLPNYRWLPVAYHGRTSSLLLSGQSIHRPSGQIIVAGANEPIYAPCRRLDYEAELGFFIGSGNALGAPIPIDEVEDHLFGVSLLNDWSARDIQTWEYQPLGPFLAKSFATTLSPWVVTIDALEPFRRPHHRPKEDAPPPPHLQASTDQTRGAIDIKVEVLIQTARMRAAGEEPFRVSSSTYADSYWTLAQIVAHHASNGCNLQPGDLLGSGTLSGPGVETRACLLELTEGGRNPVGLPNGETRVFLQDGDTLIMRGHCEAEGFARIGLGQCETTIFDGLGQ